ncbi:MAG: 23S rRNA (pseudouridine(1915)-N(3))-methyltransferase RlmH [Desulfonauticus sp.]|nr:23S rRNA (pseudouridine(1915)-N(3))-methyltransferase RlmH [Desulfonauticus sp.]
MHVGKAKKSFYREAQREYLQKINKICNIEDVIIKDSNKKEIFLQQKENEKEILNKLDPKDSLILLDERGKLFKSIEFSNFIQKIWKIQKTPCFVIGGPYGHNESIKQRAQHLISLSPLTFTHDLAYILLLEQIYRALTIIIKHPYHH